VANEIPLVPACYDPAIMKRHLEQLDTACRAWEERGWPAPDLLLVSGSGLAVDLIGAAKHQAGLKEVVPFQVRGVAGHPLEFQILEPIPGKFVAYQRGRLHSYQGYDANETVFVVRLAALLGAKRLVMSNAAGGVRPDQKPGEIAIIRDHINLTGLNPLTGALPTEWGPQFPDMLNAYDRELRELAARVAAELDVGFSSAVYAAFAGPSFETAAEIEMARTLGADLVGMSTVLEVIAARQMGVRCLCFSLISNLAAGVTNEPVDHLEVLEASAAAAGRIGRLLTGLLTSNQLYA